jgi:uncharacterized protein
LGGSKHQVDALTHASLPDHLAALLHPRAYPHPVVGPTLIETHVSWVLLTGEFAYKIKRPVCFPFIDLRSLERRGYFCREELRLNRRFASQLYLEVCAITTLQGEARIGGAGEVTEYAVKMRQFPREEELDNLLAHARIGCDELATFGRELASIHASLPVALPPDSWGDPQRIRDGVLKNVEECAQASEVFERASAVRELQPELEERLSAAVSCMSDRRAVGRVRECHGDLHCANIVRLQSRLVAFDCMEFEPAFRWIDVAEEVAFLLADLEAQQRPLHAQAFLDGYLAASGDYQACRLLPLYKAHRALVRAKVVALSKTGARARHLAYLDCAALALRGGRPILILMSGLSGSGKTWLAERLAPVFGAVHVRSDVERKRLAGLAARSRSGAAPGEGIYSKDFSRVAYKHLAAAAEDVIAGGINVIVDATFSRRDDRNVFRELAGRLSVTICLVHCQAPQEVLVSRIVERQRGGTDPSEADTTILDWQRERWEPIAADERWTVIAAETAHVDLSDLTQQIRSLR